MTLDSCGLITTGVDLLGDILMTTVAQMAPTDRRSEAASRASLFKLIFDRSFQEGEFTLSSGRSSNMYFNMKPTMMLPEGAYLAAEALMEIANDLGSEYVGGLEMGAVPVIGSMAAISWDKGNEIRTIFVRKAPKQHGTRNRIEGLAPGESLRKKCVLIIDDVATSGASILKAVEAVREMDGIVDHAACLVNRQEGADAFLRERGVKLHSVFCAEEFLNRR